MPVQGIQNHNRLNVQRAIRRLVPGDMARQAQLENIVEAAARQAWAHGVRWAHHHRKEAGTLARWPDHMRRHASQEFMPY